MLWLRWRQSYRERMREYAQMRALEVWYSHMDAEVFIEEARSAASKKEVGANREESLASDGGSLCSKNRQGDKRTHANRGSSAIGVPPTRERRDEEK